MLAIPSVFAECQCELERLIRQGSFIMLINLLSALFYNSQKHLVIFGYLFRMSPRIPVADRCTSSQKSFSYTFLNTSSTPISLILQPECLTKWCNESFIVMPSLIPILVHLSASPIFLLTIRLSFSFLPVIPSFSIISSVIKDPQIQIYNILCLYYFFGTLTTKPNSYNEHTDNLSLIFIHCITFQIFQFVHYHDHH